jgi:uncharacterized protein (DUF1499 family)
MAQAKGGAAQWASRLGVAGVTAFVVGPLLAYIGIVPAIVGFVLFDLGGLLGLVALVTGIVGALRGGGAGIGLGLGVVMTLAFVVIAAPGGKFPRINDITTDTSNPPRFVAAGSIAANQGRDMNYPGVTFTTQQRAGYPDLGPLKLNVSPDDAFKRVEATARQMPVWEITHSDAAAHALEGVATSNLFHFKDDFVIEVRPQESGSVVQMRSKSRDGQGDLGANALRIKAFFAKLQ